jgi:hypothetical protein
MPSTIHQVLNLPSKGTAMSLGPVKIDAVYETKLSSNGKNYRNISISDNSGKSKMSLWGAACDCNLKQGDTVTFVGTLKKNEYNGAVSISSESCSIAGSSTSLPAAPTTSAVSLPETPTAKVPLHELARQMALFTFEFQEALRVMEIPKETIEKMVVRAPEFAALWWFGEKQLKEASADEIPMTDD